MSNMSDYITISLIWNRKWYSNMDFTDDEFGLRQQAGRSNFSPCFGSFILKLKTTTPTDEGG